MLVKAVPRPSKGYRETVCCAGVTASGVWRRLYPVRFRQLVAEQQFARWQWVDYTWQAPRGDYRRESRRIEENTLQPGRIMPGRDRLGAVLPLLRASTREAARQQSLLDRDVSDFQPCPYAVAMAFTDQDGTRHAPQCGDWETTATFFNMRRRGADDAAIIAHLRAEFTEQRHGRRIFLAMGTVAKRPRQWLLLGVLRVQDAAPGQLALAV